MKNQICNNCRWYSAFYTKESCGFAKLTKGSCRKHNKPCKFGESCENWVDDGEKCERRRRIVLEELYKMSCEIGEIAEILRLEHGNKGS